MKARIELGRVVVDPEGSQGDPIVGRSGDSEWVAAKASPGYAFVDWQAPLGGAITYTHQGQSTPVLLFEAFHRDAIASLDGLLVAPIVRAAGRERQIERDQAVFLPKGSRLPYTLHAGPNQRQEQLVFGADASSSAVVERILDQPRLVVRHNQSQCPVRRCSIPAVRLFATTSATATFVGQGSDGEFNRWQLEGVEPRPPAQPVAANSWADVAVKYVDWSAVAAAHSSWADVREGI